MTPESFMVQNNSKRTEKSKIDELWWGEKEGMKYLHLLKNPSFLQL